MKVAYFGTYEREYPRNAQVISCLRGAGVDVVEHHVDVWGRSRHNFRAGPVAAARIALAELRLLARPRTDFDAIIVGYPGHFDVPRAKRRDPARTGCGLPRRRGGTDLRARLGTAAAVRSRVRREADPAARSRDDPRSRGLDAGDPVPDRGERPARRPARDAACKRR